MQTTGRGVPARSSVTPACSSRDQGTVSKPSVVARRVVQHSRAALRSQIVRLRRAQFALIHLDREGVPEARLARPIELAARAASAMRPQRRRVAIDKVLVGGEHGVSARRIAAELSEPLRPSTRLVDGALAEFIRRYQEHGDSVLTPDALRASAMYREASTCRQLAGSYHGAESDDALFAALRELARVSGSSSEPVLVRRVKHSNCFQLLATGPNVARALVNLDATLDVHVLPIAVTTPLQDLLIRMSWLAGDRQLYQPIAAPELETWPLVRQCTDRLEMMRAFLDGLGDDSVRTYLDVASCYGWFVEQMLEQGYDAFGVERDELAVECGRWAYHLDPDRVTSAEAEPFLRATPRRFDAVSCFSLLHHAVVAGDGAAVRLVQDLDAVTGRVLFIDTGEEHESWLREVLPGWSPEFIASWIQEHTTFSDVIALGTDRDRRPPNGDNYGRTLFACIR
jgi:hypothetical protein